MQVALTTPDRLPPGVEVSGVSNAKVKSLVGNSRLCCGSVSASRYGMESAGSGGDCGATVEPEASASGVPLPSGLGEAGDDSGLGEAGDGD